MITKRPQQQIDEILSRTSDTVILKNFVSGDEVNYLYNFFENNENKKVKKSGPVTLDVENFYDDTVFQLLFESVQRELNLKLEIFGGNFFQSHIPFIIHNDVPKDHNIIPGKCIVVPLKKHYTPNWDWAPSDTDAKFYIFDQMYFHYPVKCFKNNETLKESPYNLPIYDYSDVYGIHRDNRQPDIDIDHITRDNRQWAEGFSVEKECVWVPGDIIIFDCARLHCASNFLTNGIERKTGLSLFTSYV